MAPPKSITAAMLLGLSAGPALAQDEQSEMQEPKTAVTDLGNGEALLTIQEEVPWAVALAIIERLRGAGPDVEDDEDDPHL